MRKFIFSLKTLVMSLALVVGGSAWAQITGLPFVADFSSGEIAPFTGGSGAFVATVNDGSDAKVIAANNGEAYAQFDAPYVISNMEEVTVSFQMLNGWLGSGAGNKFAILNSDGVALAAVVYDNKSCNFSEVILDNTMAEDFTAFNGQSSAGAKGANGYDNGKGQGFKLNTAETLYNPVVTIKINSFGGISVSIVGGNNNNNVTYSRAAQPGTKLDLDKVYITNASNNGDRATGYYDLKITSKSMIKYSNDYSDDVVTWTSATGGRYTPIIQDGYLTVNQDERNNNGTTITSTETEGKVAAGENFTMSCRVKLGASTNQTATAFNIYDAANAAAIFSIAEVVTNATAWTINSGTQTATVSAGGGKAIDELAWIDVKVTSIAGGKTYLTLKDADGNIIDGFDKKDIPTLSTEGGLGKMNFVTSRYNANFAIDDIIVRDVVESEDIPATPIYTYTVKYVDQDNFEFKEPAKREEYEGVELAITDEDKETVIHGSIKYTYVSDDAAGQTAASDGSTVITVTFNKTTVTDYTVNFLDTSNGEIKAAVVHKNVLVGTEVSATQGELSKILKEGVFYEYASGNEPITLVEDAASNVINLYFAPVEGVTGYFFNNYEDKTVDWTTATGGRYDPVAVDGSKIADRGTTERKPVVDPETGEPQVDPETGEPMYEEVPGLSIPFGNKTYFLSVNQANRNNNGAAVNKASLAIEQADFTFEAKVLLGSSNNQNGTNLLIKNFAGDANIFKIAQKAEGNTTSWIINDDAENFTVVLPNSGTFAGTDNNNLTNYDWYNLKVTVYNGITFVTITDKEGTAILDKAQVPTQATSYGVGAMQFNSSRYNANLGLDDVTVRSVVTSEDVPAGAEFVAVKINYVDEAGTPLKESAEVNFQVGQPIVLNSAFTADFKVDAEGNVWTAESESAPVTKYIYVSDNSDEVEVALDAQVNIVFRGVASRRVALRYQYQTVDGDMKTKDAAGANLPFFYDSNKTGDVLFEGDELTFYYPFYLLVDGLLYQSTGNNSSGADKATLVVEPGTSTQVKSPVTWTPALEEEEQIDNAIFAQESENIEGMTVVKDGYTQIRMANGAAGSAIGGNVLITTLEPGTYTITSATRSGLTNFLAGDEVVFSVESSGTVVTSTSGEFTVDQTTPLYIEEQSAISKYSDYVLVRQLSSIEGYEITVSDEIENGTVEIPTAAAAGAVIKPVLTADAGYELESSEITVKDAEGAEVTVADGAFTMPASAVTVTVKATFVPKKIYIETDLTSQFLALTDKSTWTSETSSGVGIAEWAAPQVTVAGNKYYMIENYVEGQDKKLATGGVMYNTIKGLTPGLYTIELYGSAALTPGRSDMTTDFEEGDDASLHAVYLYAEAGGNKTQKYIPCLIESNFNNRGGEESIPTATLDNVEVGEDGTIKIGIYKEVGLTNWHIVQLKSVTAKILASDLLEAAVVAAGMIDDDDVPEALYREIQETIATYNKAYDTAEEYLTAVEALKAVVAKAEAYAPLAEAIEAGEDIKENVSKESAIAEYDEAIAPIISAYEAVAVEDIPAATVRVTAANVTLAKVQDAPNSDLTIVAENSEWINRSGTYAGDCAERWNGSAYEAGKVLYQRIEGLIPNATYEVQFLAVANVAWISAATGEGIAQVFANDAAKDIEVYDQTGCDPTQYKHTLQATADAEGVFEYGLQNVATGGNWYVAKAVALTFKGASYAISYADGMVGGMVSGPVVAFEGDEVALTVTPNDGYELASIAVTNEAGEEIEVMYDSWDGIATFEMPAEAVYVAATFQEAYVKLSDFAIASTGILDEDGDVEITGTYEFETAGSYSEMFFGEVVYDVQITAEGLAEPIEVSITGDELDGEVSDYVANLVAGTEYTANLVGVHVWDYISFTEIFTKVAELGGVLATTQFTVINQPVIEPLLVDINVERYTGYGYTPTVAEVDFTDALEFLGVDEITTDMLSFVNPDLTTISYADYMAANYDGWCDETGKATNWGSTTKICVKFFQAVEDGKYEICDMNGADVVGTTYTVRWVANVDTKVVVFTTNVTFVEEPTPAPEIAAEVDVPVVIQAGTAYEGATATFNIEDVTGPLFLDDISEAAQYIVNVTDGSFVPNSTDGWRDANGDAATWGTGDGMVCVKIQQPATGSIDYIGAIDQTYQDGDTYTAKWGFVNTASNTAVVLNINITFSDDPTGFAELKAADGVKPNGKYIEGNKVVIWQNGTKFSTSGTIAR